MGSRKRNVLSSSTCQIYMELPQLSPTLAIDKSVICLKNLSPTYDMILGLDLIIELGLMIDGKNKCLHYEHLQVPFEKTEGEHHVNSWKTGIKEPEIAEEAVNRVKEILDAKYAPIAPQAIIDKCTHLTEEQKKSLLPILIKHRSLFDGSLGKWKGLQHKIELKDPSLPPIACKPYPVHRSRRGTLMLEIQRLCVCLLPAAILQQTFL